METRRSRKRRFEVRDWFCLSVFAFAAILALDSPIVPGIDDDHSVVVVCSSNGIRPVSHTLGHTEARSVA